MRDRIQQRDLEILRTLHRLRFATTRELGMFFPSPSAARRRMAQLSEMNLIRTHSKGVDPVLRYQAWRLAADGAEAVLAAFPDEPMAHGLLERLPEIPLYNILHREAISRIYLRLLQRAAGPAPHDQDMRAVAARVAALRARAFDLWWQPDGDVQLKMDNPGGPTAADWAEYRHQEQAGKKPKRLPSPTIVVVPDATVCPRTSNVRLFLELDRSTRSLKRIADTISSYRTLLFYDVHEKAFSGTREPMLLYVVHSEARRRGIADLLDDKLPRIRRGVVVEADAPAWLEEHLPLPVAPRRRPRPPFSGRRARCTTGSLPIAPRWCSRVRTFHAMGSPAYTSWARPWSRLPMGTAMPPDRRTLIALVVVFLLMLFAVLWGPCATPRTLPVLQLCGVTPPTPPQGASGCGSCAPRDAASRRPKGRPSRRSPSSLSLRSARRPGAPAQPPESRVRGPGRGPPS